jgi:prophage antirepressor-like protein
MNNLQVFTNERLGKLRVMQIKGQAYFVGKDIAEALGYSNTRDALAKHIHDDDKITVAIHDGNKGNPNQICINESGMYALIFGSKLEAAKEFKHWVTSEVLPSIRKTGGYNSQQSDEYKEKRLEMMMINAKARLMKEQNRRMELIMKYPNLNTDGYTEDLPPIIEKVYTASEAGELLGVSANKIGRIATKHGIKTEEYGEWFKDKAKFADKEVPSFRYSQKGIDKLKELLEKE